MVNLFGKEYYIDFDKITEKCEIKKSEETEGGLEINVFKYELIKMCIERIFSDGYENEDDEMSKFNPTAYSLSFKIALYTLIKNEIISEYDDEEE